MGHAISDATTRAFEEQQRMKMAEDRQKAQLAQQAIENAAQRLAAERLEQYRRDEVANRQAQLGIETKRLGALDIQQQRADELMRHNMEMEKAREAARGQASVTTLPEAPGYTFLRNPSGALTPLQRPTRPGSELERTRLQLSAFNSMAPKGLEDPTSPDYQARTNAVGGILRKLNPELAIPDAPKDPKTRKPNATYKTPKGVFTWTGNGWVLPTQSTSDTNGNTE